MEERDESPLKEEENSSENKRTDVPTLADIAANALTARQLKIINELNTLKTLEISNEKYLEISNALERLNIDPTKHPSITEPSAEALKEYREKHLINYLKETLTKIVILVETNIGIKIRTRNKATNFFWSKCGLNPYTKHFLQVCEYLKEYTKKQDINIDDLHEIIITGFRGFFAMIALEKNEHAKFSDIQKSLIGKSAARIITEYLSRVPPEIRSRFISMAIPKISKPFRTHSQKFYPKFLIPTPITNEKILQGFSMAYDFFKEVIEGYENASTKQSNTMTDVEENTSQFEPMQ